MIFVKTPSKKWQSFCDRISAFLEADTIDLSIDGNDVHGYRSPDSAALWIRDHSDIIRGGRYFASDMRNTVDAFAAQQASNGRVYDFVTRLPMTGSNERENWEKWIRVPVEADVEFRFVNAAFLTWQATGDTEWVKNLIPALESAVNYSMSHPWRWDAEHQLVKRAYTIDTWDFDYTAGKEPWLNFQVTDDTFWGIMHGDNSGVYQALSRIAILCRECGMDDKAASLEEKAEALRERANKLLFNGEFYTHFYKLTDVKIDGVDESQQLSLSNPMDINRGLATQDIADAIVRTYIKRGEVNDTFAPWYSIDPPFPGGTFGDEKLVPGSYCNGGVMPLVGGELARAALESGHENYGVNVLDIYHKLIEEAGETYLWYFPDGTHSTIENSTSPEAMPTDGWGSSAMLWAFVEGLAGVQDIRSRFESIRFTPRWLAAGESEAEFKVSYPVSGAEFSYNFEHRADDNTLFYRIGASTNMDASILLPNGATPAKVAVNGKDVSFDTATVGGSRYATFSCTVERDSEIEVKYGI